MSNILRRMPASLILPVIILTAGSEVSAQEPPPQPPAQQEQRTHVVKKDDTLWDLARFYLGSPWLWPMIYEANRAVVENPHWIYPGERIIIPPAVAAEPAQPRALLGEPVVVSAEVPVIEEVPPPPMPEPQPDTAMVMATLDLRRPVVPLSEVLRVPYVSETAPRTVVGRILRVADPAASADRIPSSLYPQTRVHLGSLTSSPQVGDSLLIVRFGRRIGDYGVLVQPLGILRVDTVTSTVVTARVINQFGDAKVGDVVLPLGTLPYIALGDGDPVLSGPEGQLLQFNHPEPMQSTTDLAFISLGADAGVGIGDDFLVYIPARRLDNERPEMLPAQDVAIVRVVKVGERTSTVRVTSISNTGLRAGLPVRLIRRMP